MAVSACRLLFKRNFLKTSSFITESRKTKSDAHIAMTDDNLLVVCWHPEKHFPYEMSRPIEMKTSPPSESVLKVQSSKELLTILKPKKEEEVVQKLMAITHTTKHIWFPPKRQFKKKPPCVKDRPYL